MHISVVIYSLSELAKLTPILQPGQLHPGQTNSNSVTKHLYRGKNSLEEYFPVVIMKPFFVLIRLESAAILVPCSI